MSGDKYDEGYLRNVEKRVNSIHERALEKVRQLYPGAEFVIDKRNFDDYCESVWDYPGQWYVSFSLPKGFRSENDLINRIAADTIAFWGGKKR